MSSTMPPPPVPGLTVNTYFGPPLIGLLIATFLSGLLFLQVVNYFLRYPNDRLWMKSFIAILFIFDMAHLVSLCHYVYYNVVSNWGNWIPVTVVPVVASFGIEIIIGSSITSAVQMFFLYRVYVLSHRKWWLIIGPAAMSCIGLSFGVWVAIITLTASDPTPAYASLISRNSIVWFSMTSATDILIAFELCYYLHTIKNAIRTGLINRLMLYSINTGLLTGVIAFVDLAFVVASPRTEIHTAFNFPLCRIYSNSLLASLNSRQPDGLDTSSYYVSNFSPSRLAGTTSSGTDTIPLHNLPRRHMVVDAQPDQFEAHQLRNPKDSDSGLYSGKMGRNISGHLSENDDVAE